MKIFLKAAVKIAIVQKTSIASQEEEPGTIAKNGAIMEQPKAIADLRLSSIYLKNFKTIYFLTKFLFPDNQSY